jgi:hypothetical protein
MPRSGRKLLYSAERVHAMFARMRSELAEQHFRHLCAQADLRRELDAARADLDALRDAILRRQAAEQEVATLRRAREIARCTAIERDGQLLH